MLNQKGQYLSAEQMMLFTLGVILTISIYFSFSSITENVSDVVSEDQLEEVGTLILSSIKKVNSISSMDNNYVGMQVNIPQQISGETYKIKTTGEKLLIIQGDRTVTMNLGGIENIAIGEEVTSSKGKISVTFENKEINLGR